jgi:hypothetical protein
MYAYIHVFIYIYRERERLQGGRRGKENDRQLIMLKYIASISEGNITKCIESS